MALETSGGDVTTVDTLDPDVTEFKELMDGAAGNELPKALFLLKKELKDLTCLIFPTQPIDLLVKDLAILLLALSRVSDALLTDLWFFIKY